MSLSEKVRDIIHSKTPILYSDDERELHQAIIEAIKDGMPERKLEIDGHTMAFGWNDFREEMLRRINGRD